MVTLFIENHPTRNVPQTIHLEGHHSIRSITLCQDIGDGFRRSPAMEATPCFIIEFNSTQAADDAMQSMTSKYPSDGTPKSDPYRVSSTKVGCMSLMLGKLGLEQDTMLELYRLRRQVTTSYRDTQQEALASLSQREKVHAARSGIRSALRR